MMNRLLLAGGLVGSALCSPTPVKPRQAAVSPVAASTTLLANVTDPSVSRDSCGSTRFGSRIFWTCRDTTPYDASSGMTTLPLITNTGSWSDLNGYAAPATQQGPVGAGSDGTNSIHLMYGGNPTSTPSFYPVQPDQCDQDQNGVCSDGTRWVVWPNQPPMVTVSNSDGSGTGYTWIADEHNSDLSVLNPENPYSLWRVDYTPGSDQNALPTTTIINENWWAQGEIGYGTYGQVIGPDGYAYLYGLTDQGSGAALAKVPIGSVEDKTQYQYYVDGAWTATQPNINDTSAIIPNAGFGGQGTVYYSNKLSSYVWIGQQANNVIADFYITTAPAPEGPWIDGYLLYSGANGDSDLPSYSLQAHYDLLSPATENGIYLTWTQNFKASTYGAIYVTPLVYVAFQ